MTVSERVRVWCVSGARVPPQPPMPGSVPRLPTRNRRPVRAGALVWWPRVAMGRRFPGTSGSRCEVPPGRRAGYDPVRATARAPDPRICGLLCVRAPDRNRFREANDVLGSGPGPGRPSWRAWRTPRDQPTCGDRRTTTNRPSSVSPSRHGCSKEPV